MIHMYKFMHVDYLLVVNLVTFPAQLPQFFFARKP